jgi:hypothetical protein
MIFIEQKPLLNHKLVRHAIVVLGKNTQFLPPLLAAIMRGPKTAATAYVKVTDRNQAGHDPLRPVANVGYLELKTIETFPHKSRLKLYGTAFQGTTLIHLREMHDLRSTIT